MANKIQIRRGLKTNLPVLDVGEPALCTDTKEVFVGNTGGNVALVNKETLDAHAGNYILQIPYGIAAGSANAYTVTLNPAMASYVEGVAVAVKINVSNTGASTININGLGAKSIRDAKGNTLTAGKLLANSIYTLRYNGSNFILQGEGASGNALASDLLSGKTASTDAGEITGTMPNRASNVNAQGSSISGTTIRLRPYAGYYPGDAGNSVQLSDPNFVAANIKSGVSIFGLTGQMGSPPVLQIYDTPGNFNFTVPAGVYLLTVFVGGGAGGTGSRQYSNQYLSGTGGAGGTSVGIIKVTPGQVIPLTVGSKGTDAGLGGQTDGENSSIAGIIGYGGKKGIMGTETVPGVGGAGGAAGTVGWAGTNGNPGTNGQYPTTNGVEAPEIYFGNGIYHRVGGASRGYSAFVGSFMGSIVHGKIIICYLL